MSRKGPPCYADLYNYVVRYPPLGTYFIRMKSPFILPSSVSFFSFFRVFLFDKTTTKGQRFRGFFAVSNRYHLSIYYSLLIHHNYRFFPRYKCNYTYRIYIPYVICILERNTGEYNHKVLILTSAHPKWEKNPKSSYSIIFLNLYFHKYGINYRISTLERNFNIYIMYYPGKVYV